MTHQAHFWACTQTSAIAILNVIVLFVSYFSLAQRLNLKILQNMYNLGNCRNVSF